MDTSNSELTTLGAAPVFVALVISIIAAVRRYVPSIDGWKNLLLAFVISEIVAISFRVMQHPNAPLSRNIAEGVIGGFLLALAAVGANEKANGIVDRHAKAVAKSTPRGDQRLNGAGTYGSSSSH